MSKEITEDLIRPGNVFTLGGGVSYEKILIEWEDGGFPGDYQKERRCEPLYFLVDRKSPFEIKTYSKYAGLNKEEMVQALIELDAEYRGKIDFYLQTKLN